MGFSLKRMWDSFDDTFLDPITGAEEAPSSIDVSEYGPGAAGRNYAGDIASETFSATGAEPQFTGPTGFSTNGGPMTWTTPSITTSNNREMFAGGDSMFQNHGMAQSRFPGFVDALQMPQMTLGNSVAGPGAMMMGGQQGGGMPGFVDAIKGGLGNIVGWIGENPEGAAALGGLAANVYSAHEQGEIAEEREKERQEERERRRRLSEVLTPYLGEVLTRPR